VSHVIVARAMIATAKPDSLVGMFSYGGLSHEQVMRSIELFATEVRPALGGIDGKSRRTKKSGEGRRATEVSESKPPRDNRRSNVRVTGRFGCFPVIIDSRKVEGILTTTDLL
jgi:CBS domain-containing protein